MWTRGNIWARARTIIESVLPTARQLYVFSFQVIIMNPSKHQSLWNPPKHSHWRPDDWAFFSGCNYEPTRWLYLFYSGCNYESYRGPDNCTFFFSGCNYEPTKTSELVEPPQPFPLTARRLSLFFTRRNYEPARRLYLFVFQVVIIIPINGQTTVHFFFQVVIMNRWNIRARGTPPTIPTDGQTTEPLFFSRRYYAPAKRLYLFYFQVVIIIPTEGQMTVRFFSGCNYEPAETSKLVEPPQTFPLMARRLNLFFFGRIYEPARRLYLFLSGCNYHSYQRPQTTGLFFF